jgi:hypothetical protein
MWFCQQDPALQHRILLTEPGNGAPYVGSARPGLQ